MKKIISLILSVTIFLGIFSCSTPVLATAVGEINASEDLQITSGNVELAATENVTEGIKTEEPEVLNEVVEWRKENTKYFRNSDGTYTAAQYPYPVHYKENGKWKEIDNTLTEKSLSKSILGGEKEFVAEKTNTPASFPDGFEDDGSKEITVSAKGHKISFAPKESQKGFKNSQGKVKERADLDSVKIVEKANEKQEKSIFKVSEKADIKENKKNEKFRIENKSGVVVYEDVFNNVNLEYELSNSKIKESIVLNEKQDSCVFSFNMDLGGLYPVLCENGSINLCSDKTGETPVAKIEAPYMVDSLGEYSAAVEMSIKENGEEYILTVIADEKWLNDNNRAYPVVIDPTINLDIDSAHTHDCYVNDLIPNETLPYDKWIYVGNNRYGTTRAFVKFDLPDLPDDNCIITNAAIVYYQYEFDPGNGTTEYMTIHKVTENWDTVNYNITWNNQPSFSGIALDYAKYDSSQDSLYAYNFDITRTVKEWYEGGANYGVVLKLKNETASKMSRMVSAEHPVDNYYPEIYVTFRNNKGLEGYWDYSSFDVGAAGMVHINDYSGNLVYELPLLTSVSEMMPVSLVGYYNNYCANKLIKQTQATDVRTTIGKGFRLNYQQTVLPSTKYGLDGDDATKYPYVYTDGDGTEHYFQKVTKDGKTTYEDEDGLGLTLKTECDISATYQITDKAHYNYYFNSKGNLFKIVNNNGNELNIKYKGESADGNLLDKSRISKIVDGAGHTYTFGYLVNSSNVETDFLSTITDNAGRVISFSYSDYRLIKVTYYDETVTKINYDIYPGDTSEGVINTIISNDVYELDFDYTSKATGRRVSRVREYALTLNDDGTYTRGLGQVITYDRTKYNTTVMRSCGMDGTHYWYDDTKGADDIVTTVQYDNWGRATSQFTKYASGAGIGGGSVQYTQSADDSADGFKNKVGSSAGIGKSIENLILGGNAEALSPWDYYTVGTITATTGAVTSDRAYMGKASLRTKVTKIGTENARCYYRQTLNGYTAGDTYTFSAYVRTENIALFSDAVNSGVYLQLAAYDASGNAIETVTSQIITKTTATTSNGGWRRLTATMTLPTGIATLRLYMVQRNCTGEAYFDCIQLESGSVANSYNMLENSSFERYSNQTTITSWSNASAMPESNTDDGVSTAVKIHGERSVKINGIPGEAKGISQKINVKGNSRDTYIVGGWAKGYAINSTFHTSGSGDDVTYNAKFEIEVSVIYSKKDANGNTSTVTQEKTPAKFNTTIGDWQYATVPIVLKYTGGESGCTYTPTAIRIMPRYNKQENSVFFDHLMLVKDGASSYTYDGEGNLLNTSSNSEQKASMTYDSKNNLTSYKDTAGYTTSMTYDGNNNLQTQKSPRAVKTEYTYNADGLYRSTETHNGWLSINAGEDGYEAPTRAIRTSQTYHTDDSSTAINESAFVKAVYDEDYKKTSFTYNLNSGKVKKVTNPKGVETINEYGTNYGKLLSTTVKNSCVSYSYDDANRLSTIKFGNTASTRYEKYSFTYSLFGNVKQTKVGSQALSTNSYNNNNGALEKTTYGNGDSRRFEYNNLGLQTAVYGTDNNSASEAERLLYSWKYSSSGEALGHTDRVNGLKYIADYDSLGRLSKEEIQKSSNSEYIGSAEYGYDVRNNLTSLVTDYGGKVSNQRYYYSQVEGNDNSGSFAKDNLPTMYKLSADRYAIYTYDDINRLTLRRLTLDAPLYYNYTYKSSGWNNAEQYAGVTSKYTTTLLEDEYIGDDVYVYSYDSLGNITSIKKATRSTKGSGTPSHGTESNYVTYTYDDLGQLTKEANVTSNIRNEWTYDALGNITSKKEYNRTTGVLKKTITYNYTDGDKTTVGWNNLLTSITTKVHNTDGTVKSTTTKNITCDAIGNPTKYLGATLTWNGRQLTSYKTADKEITYTYDANGLRASKTEKAYNVAADGTKTLAQTTVVKYYYVNGQLHFQETVTQKPGEAKTTDEHYFYYDSNGYLTAIGHKGGIYYAATNQRGDVVALYYADGRIMGRYEYDAWGNIIKIEDISYDSGGDQIIKDVTNNTTSTDLVVVNPIRYRGYYYDSETKLYYLQSRYYNAAVGRFLNVDTVDVLTANPTGITDKNLFAYCDNNPVLRADYSGDFWHIAAGAVIGGLFELGSQLLSGEKVNWAKVGVATLAGGVTAAVGPLAGAAISGAANIALDVMSGERDVKKLAVSGAVGAGSSLVGSGVGKVVEKAGGKIATKTLSKMSNTKLKFTATNLTPTIKGVERNKIKSMTYLISNYPNIGEKYFMSSQFGKTLSTSLGQISEGFTSCGVDYGIGRCFPSW